MVCPSLFALLKFQIKNGLINLINCKVDTTPDVVWIFDKFLAAAADQISFHD